jgi:hypothetical protein
MLKQYFVNARNTHACVYLWKISARLSQAAMVKNLMKNMNLTINQAFDLLDVSETDRKSIADLI